MTTNKPEVQTEAPVRKKRIQKLRSEILIILCVVVCAIVFVIVFNIVNLAKKPKVKQESPNPPPTTGAWYQNARIIHHTASRPVVAQIRNQDGSTPESSNSVSSQSYNSNAQGVLTPEQQQAIADKQARQQAAQQEADDIKAAMRVSVTTNQLTPQNIGSTAASANAAGPQGSLVADKDSSGLPKDDQMLTAEKRKFVEDNSNKMSDVLSSTVMQPVAQLVLNWGTLIPAKLDRQINSDLPGQIYGHITRDVYDSRTHDTLLIPAGSQLVGNYDSAIAYGQDRLLVAWKRINFPNGQWLDLQGMGGADPVGAGFGDQVDNHYWRIFGATFLTSVLAAGAQLSQPQQSNALQAPTTGQTIGQSVGTQIANTGTMLMQKNINIQPTIVIRAGFDFQVEVNKDIVFPAAYTANPNK